MVSGYVVMNDCFFYVGKLGLNDGNNGEWCFVNYFLGWGIKGGMVIGWGGK